MTKDNKSTTKDHRLKEQILMDGSKLGRKKKVAHSNSTDAALFSLQVIRTTKPCIRTCIEPLKAHYSRGKNLNGLRPEA